MKDAERDTDLIYKKALWRDWYQGSPYRVLAAANATIEAMRIHKKHVQVLVNRDELKELVDFLKDSF